ncbi:hypothetical protein [Streptomyces bauhiniae]|nr:hypothetical protein [Streptomyces bauhiniae]
MPTPPSDRPALTRPLAALPDTREAAALLDEPLVIPPHPDCTEWVTGHAE